MARWSGSSAENWSGVGGRLGPDQKGAPDDVVMSSGKLYSSCEMELLKFSSNLSRAHTTHASSVSGLSTRLARIASSVVRRTPGCRSSAAR